MSREQEVTALALQFAKAAGLSGDSSIPFEQGKIAIEAALSTAASIAIAAMMGARTFDERNRIRSYFIELWTVHGSGVETVFSGLSDGTIHAHHQARRPQ